MPPESSFEDNRPEILKELDNFNTAPEFGMMGILREQEKNSQQAEEEIEKPVEEPKKEPEIDYSKAYAPLNSSIQELGYQQSNRLEMLERSLHDLKNTFAQGQGQQQQQSQLPANYDPEAPVSMHQYMDLINRHRQLEQSINQRHEQTAIEHARLNAHLALSEYKRLRPDFNMTGQQLDQAFVAGVSRNKNEVLSANWGALFDQLYNNTILPKRNAEYESLKTKVADLEKQLVVAKEAKPKVAISPATRTTARAIESPVTDSNNLDITNLRSFRKQGHWKEYANAIKRHHGLA